MSFTHQDLDTLIYAITALGALLGAPVAAYLYHLLLDHLPSAQCALLVDVVHTVVQAVEQTSKGMAGLDGAGKKTQAIQQIEAIASALHLPVAAPVIDVLIEAAVLALPHTIPAPDPSSAPSPLPAV